MAKKSSLAGQSRLDKILIPAIVERLGVHSRALAVWLSVHSFADNKTGLAYPGTDLLLFMTKLKHRRNLERELATLIKLGLLIDAKLGRGKHGFIIPEEFRNKSGVAKTVKATEAATKHVFDESDL